MGALMHQKYNPYYLTFFEGEGGGGSGGANPPAPAPPAPPAPAGGGSTGEASEVEKAYAKLRDAEKERDQYKAKVNEFERNALPEAERTKQERDEAKARAEKAESELTEFRTKIAATEVARNLGFRSPSVAVDLLMYRKVDLTTEAKAKAAFDELAKEDPGLVGGAPPPSGGPINPQNGEQPTGNTGFNRAIRQAAGRP